MKKKKFSETQESMSAKTECQGQFDCYLHHELLLQGQTTSRFYFLGVLKRLRESVRNKRPNSIISLLYIHAWTNSMNKVLLVIEPCNMSVFDIVPV